jgi:hypothetical protein
MTLDQLYNNLTFIINNIDRIIEDVLNQFKESFIEANRDQLKNGEASDGSVLGRYTSKDYLNFKFKIGSVSAPKVDLFVTGEFHGSLTGEFKNGEMQIGPDSTNFDLGVVLENKYNKERIYGVTVKNLTRISKQEIQPALIKSLQTILFK